MPRISWQPRTLLLGLCALLLLPLPLTAAALTAAQVAEMLGTGASFEGADLSGAPLNGLNFVALKAADSVWDRADLSGATFRGGDLRRASLVGVSLRGASLQGVNLAGAVLTDADLSAARLRHVNLVGADLTGANLAGADLNDLRLSPAGDRYLSVLGMALSHLTGGVIEKGEASRAWAAGLSTTAFAFVYDPQNAALAPTIPLTYNPLLIALQQIGAEPVLRTNLSRGKAFTELNRALQSGSAVLLALNMASPGQTGTGLKEPIWALAEAIEGEKDAARCRLQAPPFGVLSLIAPELEMRWSQEGATLNPFGYSPATGRYLLVTAKPPERKLTKQQMSFIALQKAVEVLTGYRSKHAGTPGVAGLQKLLANARAAAEAYDTGRLEKLLEWGGTPRQDLAGARMLAAQFLDAVAVVFPVKHMAMLQQAANLYRVEASALEAQWADLYGADLNKRAEVEPLIQQNVAVLGEAVAAEEQALSLLQRVAASE